MRSRLVLATVPVALLGVAVAPSLAAPKAKPKPITMTYTATAPVAGAPDCDGLAPMSVHRQSVKIPAAGILKAELSGFAGDWDFYLRSGGSTVSSSAGGDVGPGVSETVVFKPKKAMTLSIDSCNWAGGPTGSVTYTFTYK